jgi:hypothetical protein
MPLPPPLAQMPLPPPLAQMLLPPTLAQIPLPPPLAHIALGPTMNMQEYGTSIGINYQFNPTTFSKRRYASLSFFNGL